MKRAIAILLALSLLLCGCGRKEAAETLPPETMPLPTETTTSPTETTAATESPAVLSPELDAFRRVLEGRLPIFRIASQESIPISKISLFFTVEELPWDVERFTIQDLGGDGVPDAVLEVSDYMGYVILHYREDGIVTGEEIWYRAFQDLKADGSYMSSGSSFNRSYWKFHFVADILLAECYAQDNGTPVYWVNGENVDAEAFAAFEETQAAKPDAIWYDSWEDFLASTKE